MTTKRICGTLCFVLAAACVLSGINVVSRDTAIADPSGVGVSRAVGAFLPAIVFLILGLWLFQKPKAD